MGINNSNTDGYVPQNKANQNPNDKQKDLGSGYTPSYLAPDPTAASFDPVSNYLNAFDNFYGPQLEAQAPAIQFPYLPGKEPGSNNKGSSTYTVQSNDTLGAIASNNGVTLSELLFENNMKLLDASTGKILYQGKETAIQPGMVLNIPESAAEKEAKKQDKLDSQKLNQALSVEANNSDEPLRAVLKALLGFPMKFLGPTKGSKVSVEFAVNIPTPAPIVKIVLGGSFEQETKADNKALVSHKVQPKLGVKIEGSVLEGEVSLFGFFEVTAANLDDAVSLIYYGLYKLGRATGDSMNDWAPSIASGGASMGLSLAMFCGLNLMYAKDKTVANAINSANSGEIDEKSFLDKLMSAESAEHNIADIEKQLFGYNNQDPSKPFDESNVNEVAYGGGIEGKVSAGNDDVGKAEGSLTFTGKNAINAQNLNATGNYGVQEANFMDDYKIGGLKEMQLELGGGFESKGNGISGKHSFTWGEELQSVNSGSGVGKKGDSEIKWVFKKYEYSISGKLGGLAKIGDETTRTLIEQIITIAVANYNEKKEEAKKKDTRASVRSLGAGELAEKALLELGLAETTDMFGLANNETGPLKVTDSLTLGLKFTAYGATQQKKPEVELSIGRLQKKEVDIKVAEFSFSDLDVIGTFKLL